MTPFDVAEPRGFAIAGSDHKFVQAQAKIVGPDTIEVWSDQVSEPVAVRYAWADNPVCNLYSGRGPAAHAVPHRRLARRDDPQRAIDGLPTGAGAPGRRRGTAAGRASQLPYPAVAGNRGRSRA